MRYVGTDDMPANGYVVNRRMLMKQSWARWRFLRRMERAKTIAVQNQFIKYELTRPFVTLEF